MIRRLLILQTLFLLIFCGALAQDGYVITGRVIDVDNRQPLKNVSVTVRRSQNGTLTNDSGYFRLTVKNPDLSLVFSFVGYANVNRELHLLESNPSLLIELRRKANEQLDEVVVNAYKDNVKMRTTEMNVVKINPEQIKRAPLLFGEADIIKALILQPGITNTGEGAGGYNVRGGNADQNLVLVDGAPLFNTSHLLGFYTSVTPDAIQDVTLYKGGMPANYGGRISSLLNLKVKPGNNNRMQYSGGVGPMSARLFINGPLVKNKLNFTAGARAAYPDPILNQLKDQFGAARASFYDAIVKAEWTPNEHHKLGITAYRSFDRFKFDTANRYGWESNLATMNYSAQLKPGLTWLLNGNISQFRSSLEDYQKYQESKLVSTILHRQVKTSIVWEPGEKHRVEAGADAIFYRISPGSRNPTSDSSSINALSIQKEQGREWAIFASDEWQVNSRLTIQAGLRYALYQYVGPHDVYLYEEGVPLSKESITDTVRYGKGKSIQQYRGLEPRLSVKYALSEEMALKVSYNRGQQFLHLISNTTAISPVDFWKLSDRYLNRQIGDQYSAGWFGSFKGNKYEASVEMYYRTLKNVVAYKDGALLLMNRFIESALLNQRGRAYGIELSAARNAGKFTWQVNYTYSKSEVQVVSPFPEEWINDGKYYPSEIDRPHNVSLIGKLKLGRGWTFSTNFIFASGRPATYPDGVYVYNGTFVTNYSKRNLDRLPAYHRLDAGFTWVSKRYQEQKRYSLWNFSFYNLYMNKNAYSIFFKREGNRLNAYRLSVVGGIIPSITWNYNF